MIGSSVEEPSNSAKIVSYGRPRLCARTFSRPRCAIPITTSRAPRVAASWISSSSIGTVMSSPSIENCFWPRYALCMKRSSASTSVSRLSSAFCSSTVSGLRNSPDSIASRSHSRCRCDGDVLDLVGDRAAVGLPQVGQRVGERRAGDVHAQDPRRDLRHQLGGQAERLGVERRVALGLAAERVEPGGEVAVRAVRLEQRGRGLDRLHQLLVGRRGAAAGSRRARGRGGRAQPRAPAAAAAPAARRRGPRRRARRSRPRPGGSASIRCRNRPDSAPWMIRWSYVEVIVMTFSAPIIGPTLPSPTG